MKETLPTIQELRRLNFKVRVTHYRVTGWAGSRKPKPIIRMVTKEGKKARAYPVIGEHGGRTTIDVTRPDGVPLFAEANCSLKDSFNRKRGIRICLARLNKQDAFDLNPQA